MKPLSFRMVQRYPLGRFANASDDKRRSARALSRVEHLTKELVWLRAATGMARATLYESD